MKAFNLRLSCALGALTFASCIGHAPEALAQASVGGIDVAQQPLFTQSGQPPLNMLVMGKDHKIYYEAYNDASDLNGDGALDIGYKPASIDYYGYFDSHMCYTWSTDKFVPASATTNKQCSAQWSGDFLNYLTTSRMDALRRVLYGGWRQVDSQTETVLQGAFFPQDGHSWGKEYQSVARDGYDISNYAPLAIPPAGRYHLFAVTTVTGNANTYPNYQAPLFRVLKNTDKRVWNWLSIEGPVAGNRCFTSANARVDCVPATTGDTWDIVPASDLSGLTITTWKRLTGSGSPADRAAMNTLFTTHATTLNLCGSGTLSVVNTTGGNNNPFTGVLHNLCGQENYLTRIEGNITVPSDGTYRFGIDGDDAVDLTIGGFQLGWYGGHGSDRSAAGLLSHSNTVYLTAGTHAFTFRHQEGAGDDSWGLFKLTPAVTVSRDDYAVRVQSCPSSNAALRESTCKAYPNGQFKPTGILHDYGETARMYFGLITGTQFNNLEGGVLRRNMSNFGDEICARSGQFRTNNVNDLPLACRTTVVDGIANTISKLRMIGGGYNDSVTNNATGDTNWNWANGTGTCTSQGNRALNNAECRMWGNPLAEMLYESMRYFSGASGPTTRFNTNTTGAGATAGNGEETTLGLTQPTWKNPYAAAPDGGGFLACAKPYQTIISDINPSYDGDLPGSAFNSVAAQTGTPATITPFNAASEGQTIWNAEFGAGTRSVFIGDVAGSTDGAPTAKNASSFGNIRGLSPEEPTKGGTYYSASVARFARFNDINAVTGQQNLSTYSIALASPLPRIDFPIGSGKISLLPFAKTASGTFGDGTRKPTNTIVDFYVESIANLPGQPTNVTINGGRAYAVFRINYEDVEQGNDHDMDAIVRYLISANADGTVTVTLNSEYAAGSADQNMGYILQGSTQDGVYLDVRDTDSGAGTFVAYILNTPNPLLPGGCNPISSSTLCASQLPTNSTRIFTPVAAGGAESAASFLNDPLWYAAKYGNPTANWDVDNDGTPDNYFLVTNPATLRTQLDRAFANIIDTSQPTASVATSTPRFVPGATLAYSASYTSSDWSGDIQAYELREDGSYFDQPSVWSASQRMPTPATRDIFTAEMSGGVATGVPFTAVGMSAATKTRIQGTLDPLVFLNGELISYLRGDKSNERGATGCSLTDPTDCPYRARGSKIGDILNSTPAVIGVTSFGYGSILRELDPTAADAYTDFVESKKLRFGEDSQNPVLFVGSNDGMMHAFDGSEGTSGGRELFAYVPNAVQANLQELARPGYVHRFFVDGSPTISDAWLGEWKTVLLGSTGAGARAVYALDVTDPSSFAAGDVMWEFNDSVDARMGQFVGRPYLGITENGTWIAAFGNGLNGRTPIASATNVDNHAVLFIRDLDTGAEIATIDTNWGCSSTLPAANANACGGADSATNNRFGPNGLSTAVLVDNDGNGAGDTIYAGDYLGNLWRFEQDKVSGAWSLGNGGAPLFTARDPDGKRQTITSGAYTVANPFGGTNVIFGTGRYLNADDADETRLGLGTRASMDTIYGIWDPRLYVENEDGSPGAWYQLNDAGQPVGTRADLEPQLVTGYTPMVDGADGYRTATRNPVDYRSNESPTGRMGWYMDLSFESGGNDLLAGERVTATPQGILTDVVFNTFRPEGDTCEPGSQNATMVLDSLTGSAGYTPVEPEGGWAPGQEPPEGSLVGTDTRRGPPPGEPPIVIIRPPPKALYGVPCLEGSEDCAPPCDPATEECPETVDKCQWVSPNAADRMAGKKIPCGRISWKQMR
jgi:type IV pilus assembly protein PilY1